MKYLAYAFFIMCLGLPAHGPAQTNTQPIDTEKAPQIVKAKPQIIKVKDEGILYLRDLLNDLSENEESLKNNLQLITGTANHFPYLEKIPTTTVFSKSKQNELSNILTQIHNKLEVIFSATQLERHGDYLLSANIAQSLKIFAIALIKRFVGVKGITQQTENQLAALLNFAAKVDSILQNIQVKKT